VVALVSAGVIGFLLLRIHKISQRVASLETFVADQRTKETLDPIECPGARDVCQINLWSLVLDPSRFEGRKVIVAGRFLDAFEQSALVDLAADPHNANRNLRLAVWIDGFDSPIGDGDIVQLSGTFSRVHAGHLNQYAGHLSEVHVLHRWEDEIGRKWKLWRTPPESKVAR